MIRRSLFGPKIERFADVKDASVMEMVPVAALVVAVLVVGIYPAVITDVFTAGVEPIASWIQSAGLR